jgi:hypothetical protein
MSAARDRARQHARRDVVPIDRQEVALVMSLLVGGSEEGFGVWNGLSGAATPALPLIDRLDAPRRVSLLLLATLEAYERGDMR